MQATFTAVYTQDTETEWVIARALEYPGAITQGTTLDEARAMLQETVQRLIAERRLETEQELARHEADETIVARESVTVEY